MCDNLPFFSGLYGTLVQCMLCTNWFICVLFQSNFLCHKNRVNVLRKCNNTFANLVCISPSKRLNFHSSIPHQVDESLKKTEVMTKRCSVLALSECSTQTKKIYPIPYCLQTNSVPYTDDRYAAIIILNNSKCQIVTFYNVSPIPSVFDTTTSR